jgi:HB1, ASXL, restriction endonuclease HTH domain
MDLSGHHSNPSEPLETLLHGPPDRGESPVNAVACAQIAPPGQAARAIGARHPRQGRIIDAITRVLSDHGEPMQAREVHVGVEALLGKPVRWASVKATLAGNIHGPAPRFVRVARGRYSILSPPRP